MYRGDAAVSRKVDSDDEAFADEENFDALEKLLEDALEKLLEVKSK